MGCAYKWEEAYRDTGMFFSDNCLELGSGPIFPIPGGKPIRAKLVVKKSDFRGKQ